MIHKLLFDTTDSTTRLASANVGAYVRSGSTGTLITNTSVTPDQKANQTFVDGDVTVGTDTINISSHGFETGDLVQLTSTGTLPAGLALTTDYYVIRVDSDNIKLAASLSDAEKGTAVDITAAAGGGTHTVDTQDNSKFGLDVNILNKLGIDVDLDHTEDSVRLGDGTSYFTSTSENGDISLDVHISNSDLDIRDLSATQDNVAISDGTDTLEVNADGSINITDNGGTLTVDDGGLSLTVDATDLDIRDLTHASDSIRLGDGTTLTTVTTIGSDNGLDVNVINNQELANTAIATASNFLDVADTAEDVVTSPLANRKYLFMYNNQNKTAYIGATGVTSSNGFPLPPGSLLELRAGPSIDIEWVAEDTNQELRTMEIS